MRACVKVSVSSDKYVNLEYTRNKFFKCVKCTLNRLTGVFRNEAITIWMKRFFNSPSHTYTKKHTHSSGFPFRKWFENQVSSIPSTSIIHNKILKLRSETEKNVRIWYFWNAFKYVLLCIVQITWKSSVYICLYEKIVHQTARIVSWFECFRLLLLCFFFFHFIYSFISVNLNFKSSSGDKMMLVLYISGP